MKNLENYGVQELDAREMKEISGGWFRIIVGVVIAAVNEIVGDWENFKAGLNGEQPVNN
jgi:lactobin A/cerein 7B family class IIb bacteriocin